MATPFLLPSAFAIMLLDFRHAAFRCARCACYDYAFSLSIIFAVAAAVSPRADAAAACF